MAKKKVKKETSIVYVKDIPVKIEGKIHKGVNHMASKNTAKIIRAIFSDKFKWKHQNDYLCSVTDYRHIYILRFILSLT